ncbi:MAG: hypothetical protein VB071_07195 [Lawsonibacter sp.]|nr:hypothetical protein [Lawsonibacter sp.]
MEWPKLKNIVLIILALTNLFLFIFVAGRDLQNSDYQRKARSDAIQFLVDRGITVTESQVPHKMDLAPQTVERDLEQEGALAAQLLNGSVQVEARGGEVYRYFNENGSIQFHSDGAFAATFASGVFQVGEDREKDCLALLTKLNFEGKLIEKQTDSLTVQQLWNGVPLFTQQVTLELRDNCVTSMTAGRRLVGQPVPDTARKTVTVATAMIEFFNSVNALGDVCSRVDSITQGYASSIALSGPMTLTPVWRIVTDTGAYQLDLVTGTLTREA